MAHLQEQFLDALQHPNEKLQVAELKALFRQLPETNRIVLIMILRALYTIQNSEKLRATKSLVTDVFSDHLIWDIDDEFGAERSQDQKAKLIQLMLDHFSELAESSNSVRSRAVSAGVAPEDMKDVKGVVAGVTGSLLAQFSPPADSVASTLPPVFDEGLAAVKQLRDSNEALQALVENLEDSLQNLEGLVEDVRGLRERMDSMDQRHTSLAHDVEDKLSQVASPKQQATSKDESVASLEHKVEAWIQVVQTRLDNIEASHPDEEDGTTGKGIARAEAEEIIQASIAKSMEQKEKAHNEVFEDWRKKMEAEFSSWKDKIMLDAAKVVASQIADVTKRVDGRLSENEAKQADIVKNTPKLDPEELSRLKERVDEADAAEEQLKKRIDDLVLSVEDLSRQVSASDEQLDPLQAQLSTLAQQQDVQGAAISEIAALRREVDALSQAREAPAASADADGASLDAGAQAMPQLHAIEADLQEVKEELQRVQTVLTELSAAASAQEELKRKVESLSGSLGQVLEQEEAGRHAEIVEELDELRSSVAGMQEQISKLHDAQDERGEGGQSQALEERVGRLEDVHQELSHNHGLLSEDHAAMQATSGKLAAEVERLSAAVEALQKAALDAEVERLSAAVEALQKAAPAKEAKDEDGGGAAEGVEEAFGSLFAEHVSPEIARLRDEVHALQVLIGRPSGDAGALCAGIGGARRDSDRPRWCQEAQNRPA